MTENSQSMSIPHGALLTIANNILELLEYGSELENEEDLFRDEFYIAIVSNLVTDQKFEIVPGETEAEKIKSLDKLISFLSEIIEIDLTTISAKGIIKDHDKNSTKYLLELIEELIKALKRENEEEENSTSERPPRREESHDSNEVIDLSNSDVKRGNISDANIGKKKHNMLDDDDDDEEEEDYLQEAKKQAINKKADKEQYISDDEEEEDGGNKQQKQYQPTDSAKNMEDDSNVYKDSENPRIEQVTEPLNDIESSHDHSQRNHSQGRHNEEVSSERELMTSDRHAQSCIDTLVIMKAHQEIDESLIRRTFTENDISRLERELAENEEEDEMEQRNEYPHGMNYDEEHVGQNETPEINVSHISEVSKSKENSEQQGKNNMKKNKAESMDNYRKDSNKIKHNQLHQEDHLDKNSQSYSNQLKNDDLQEDEDINDIQYEEESNSKDEMNLTEEVAHSVPEPQTKMKLNQSSSSSRKMDKSSQQSSKRNSNKKVGPKNPNKNSQSEISQSSIHSNSQISQKVINKKTQEELNDNILEELPMNDETLKYEIIKEFRKLYGNKLDRIFLKHNLQNSHDTLEVILRNIKLAKQKMMKIANRIPEPDDLITKEFMLKYERELQYIIDYYHKEKNTRDKFQERALKTINKNTRDMKKIQEISTKKMEAEIEQRRKAREFRNQERQIRVCNEIYSKALQLEKEKNLEEVKTQMESRKRENEEKRKMMIEIEKYYLDKIAILKEILRREKRDREIEHRAKIQFLSKLEREKKCDFKKQITEVFDRFDEQDKIVDFQDNNPGEIEKILMNYYKK